MILPVGPDGIGYADVVSALLNMQSAYGIHVHVLVVLCPPYRVKTTTMTIKKQTGRFLTRSPCSRTVTNTFRITRLNFSANYLTYQRVGYDPSTANATTMRPYFETVATREDLEFPVIGLDDRFE